MNTTSDNDYNESDPEICAACSGSGEGMYDGTTCAWCNGSGVSFFEGFDESFREDDYAEKTENVK
jgi:DnaJ-class molecular chaperone